MFGLVVFLFSFTSKRNEKRKVAKIKVVFVGENNLFIKVNEKNFEIKKDKKLDISTEDGYVNATLIKSISEEDFTILMTLD